ncbi:hypothetical protein EC973_004556 [Apophysomyces ossiformis]|uniref:Uncharacterized protein n=1 Tax=Apophysomyces ossiformis TaxID=679940 RepID=A0A8H7BSL5_9FUNG|nr:hypothetical protein EC973_004556 [Apophysomyces ossiformis]
MPVECVEVSDVVEHVRADITKKDAIDLVLNQNVVTDGALDLKVLESVTNDLALQTVRQLEARLKNEANVVSKLRWASEVPLQEKDRAIAMLENAAKDHGIMLMLCSGHWAADYLRIVFRPLHKGNVSKFLFISDD